MAVAARPEAAALPLPGGCAGGAAVRVHPFVTAEMVAPPRFFDRPSGPGWLVRGALGVLPGGERLALPIPAFLIEHPSAGPILVDCGLHADVATDPAQNLGRLAAAAYTIRMAPEQAVPAQLRALGTDPDDVGLVVMTHLHHDHASGISQFPDATFVVAAREWEAATSGGFLQGYRGALIDHPVDWRTVDLEAAGEPHGPFPHSADLLGDGSIRLLATPGHTPGHMSLLLRLAGGELLLAADAAYARRTVTERWLPLFVADDDDYLRSLDRIAAWTAGHPEATVICGHDPWSRADLERVHG